MILEDSGVALSFTDKRKLQEYIDERRAYLYDGKAVTYADKRAVQNEIAAAMLKLRRTASEGNNPTTNRILDYLGNNYGMSPEEFFALLAVMVQETGDLEAAKKLAIDFTRDDLTQSAQIYDKNATINEGFFKDFLYFVNKAETFAAVNQAAIMIYGFNQKLMTSDDLKTTEKRAERVFNLKKLLTIADDPNADPEELFDLSEKSKLAQYGIQAVGFTKEDTDRVKDIKKKAIADIYAKHTGKGKELADRYLDPKIIESRKAQLVAIRSAQKRWADTSNALEMAKKKEMLPLYKERAEKRRGDAIMIDEMAANLFSISLMERKLADKNSNLTEQERDIFINDILINKKRNEEAKAIIEPTDLYLRMAAVYQKYSDKIDAETSGPKAEIMEIGKQLPDVAPMFTNMITGLIDSSPVSKEQADEWVKKFCVLNPIQEKKLELAKYDFTQFKSDIAEFYRLTNGRLAGIKFVNTRADRAFARPEQMEVAISKRFDKRTLFHELAHILEADEKVKEAANNFLAVKTGQPVAELRSKAKLSKLTGKRGYKSHERAYVDTFFDHYVGKIYSDRCTEVMSMGLQMFSSGTQLKELHDKDPEQFHLMLGIIGNKPNAGSLERSVEKKAQHEQVEKTKDDHAALMKRIDKEIKKDGGFSFNAKKAGIVIEPDIRWGRTRPSSWTINIIDTDEDSSNYGEKNGTGVRVKSEATAKRVQWAYMEIRKGIKEPGGGWTMNNYTLSAITKAIVIPNSEDGKRPMEDIRKIFMNIDAGVER